MTDIKELKQRIDIIEVLVELGGKPVWPNRWDLDEEVRIFCPFCEDKDSSRPAGRANQLRQLYYCFNCGVGGDIIELAKKGLDNDSRWEEPSFKEILDWLDGTFPYV